MSYGCRGFFPVTSFSSHSCTNNTFHKRKDVYVELENVYLNNDMEKLKPHEIILETRAKLDIKEVFMLMFSNKCCYMLKSLLGIHLRLSYIFIHQGEEITIHYSGGLKGRLVRQRLTNEGWFFSCRCSRCLSGTELGSHFSSLICSICAATKGNRPFILFENRNIIN